MMTIKPYKTKRKRRDHYRITHNDLSYWVSRGDGSKGRGPLLAQQNLPGMPNSLRHKDDIRVVLTQQTLGL
jgi:hypothetical protein